MYSTVREGITEGEGKKEGIGGSVRMDGSVGSLTGEVMNTSKG